MTINHNPEIFVGREKELKQLNEILNQAMRGQCIVTFLSGEAGTGKTSLIECFLHHIKHRVPGILIARGRCTNESELSGLTPFIEVLGDLYYSDSKSKQQSPLENEQFKQALASFKEVAPAWLDIFMLGVPSAIITTYEEGKKLFARPTAFSQRTVFEQFNNLLFQKAQDHPLIIYLDDLQWIDHSSLDLLFYISRNLKDCPILILAAYRPSVIADNSKNILRIKDDIIRYGGVELPELKQGINVIEYAAQRFPDHDFPNKFLLAIQERTEGYPLFVAQIFNWLEEQRNIEPKLDPNIGKIIGWHLSDAIVVLDHIPQSVQAVISNRLLRLEENLREILNYASVEGEDFTVQVIAQLQKKGELDLIDSLEALDQQYHLVRELGERSLSLEKIVSLYRFGHRVFRDYLYGNLSQAKRRLLHLQVAECLELFYEGQLNLIAGQLATHFRLAYRFDKACHYSLLAAQAAYNNYSWVEAINWSKTVLELLKQQIRPELDSLTYKAEAVITWENCTERLGDGFDEVINELKLLVDNINQRKELKALLARALIALGWAYYYGPGLETDAIPRRAEKVAAELDDLVINLEAKYLLAEALIDDSGKFKEALKILAEQLEIAKKLGDINKLADTLALTAWCYIYLGCYNDAAANGTESLRMLENYSNSDQLTLGFTLRVLGAAFQGMGNYDLALQMQEKSSAVYARVGDIVQLNWCRIEVAETLCAQGRFEEASPLLWEAIVFGETTKDFPLIFWSYIDSAEMNLEKGDLIVAEANLQAAQQAFETYNALVDKIKLHTTFAILFREKKNFKLSQEYIEKTLAAVAEIESDFPLIEICDVYGTIHQARGDFSQAEEWYKKSINLSEKLNARVWIANTSQHLGSLYYLQGEIDNAKYFYKSALNIRQELQQYWIANRIQKSLDLLTSIHP